MHAVLIGCKVYSDKLFMSVACRFVQAGLSVEAAGSFGLQQHLQG